jgi:hypothetical protein
MRERGKKPKLRRGLVNSSLAGQAALQQNGTTRMTTAKQYDYLNRLVRLPPRRPTPW